jgi:hypothetical protein
VTDWDILFRDHYTPTVAWLRGFAGPMAPDLVADAFAAGVARGDMQFRDRGQAVRWLQSTAWRQWSHHMRRHTAERRMLREVMRLSDVESEVDEEGTTHKVFVPSNDVLLTYNDRCRRGHWLRCSHCHTGFRDHNPKRNTAVACCSAKCRKALIEQRNTRSCPVCGETYSARRIAASGRKYTRRSLTCSVGCGVKFREKRREET